MLDLAANLDIENSYQGCVAGVDEAGRGPWAGPVVAAAVIIKQGSSPKGINDSKKISPKKREELYFQICESTDYGIGIVDVDIIDEGNILQATKLAMKEAVEQLNQKPEVVLVDGNASFSAGCQVVPIIKGDEKVLSIGAASILAKVTRDRIMKELHNEYPHYGWDSNMGYGTKQHQAALQIHGATPHHRTSFKPIKQVMSSYG